MLQSKRRRGAGGLCRDRAQEGCQKALRAHGSGQHTASHQDALRQHLCASSLTPLSPPGGREKAKKEPPRVPPRRQSERSASAADVQQAGGEGGCTPPSAELWAPCSLSGSQETAPSAAGPCPELLGRSSFCPLPLTASRKTPQPCRACGRGAGRAGPALGGPEDIRGQLLSGVHTSTLIQARYSHAQPQSRSIASKAMPWPPGKGKKPLLFLPLLRLL